MIEADYLKTLEEKADIKFYNKELQNVFKYTEQLL